VDAEADRIVQQFSVAIDGLKIRGRIFFPAARPDRLYPTLVICHGVPAGPAVARPPEDPGYEGLAQEFASVGVAAVIFNFRGCGDSDGNFDLTGWTRDLEAVLDTVANTPHIDPTRVMVLGFSGGGAAAVKVASESQAIYGLAAVGTPSDFSFLIHDPQLVVADFRNRGIIRDPGFPADVQHWAAGFLEIEPRRWIQHFKGKYLLIVHGDQDELIPVEQARELMEHAPAGVGKLAIIPGGVHKLRLDPRCIEIVKEWVLEILGQRPR
jgi:alpha-beta hydrolase superfamily lysophospholipase